MVSTQSGFNFLALGSSFVCNATKKMIEINTAHPHE